jgi:hypothetical protein
MEKAEIKKRGQQVNAGRGRMQAGRRDDSEFGGGVFENHRGHGGFQRDKRIHPL